MTRKQALILVSLFVFAILISFAYFFFFIRQPESTLPENELNTFFPVSTGQNPPSSGDSFNTGTTTVGPSTRISALRLISGEPVSGYLAFDIVSSSTPFSANSPTDREPTVNYTQRGTGHVFQSYASNLSQKRLSNTTIPKVYEALYVSSTTPIYRYLNAGENVTTFSGTLSPASTTLNGVFLPVNIKNIVSSPLGSQIAYVTITSSGGSSINIANPSGGNASSVYTSDLTEWLLQWPVSSTIFITTKADSRYAGFLYSINTQTSAVTKVLSNLFGLTTLVNPDATKIIYSYTSTRGIETSVFNTTTGNSMYLPVQTLSEKCVWSKKDPTIAYCAVPAGVLQGNYPEAWYQGRVTFNDSIYRIDTSTNTAKPALAGSDLNGNIIDMVNLQLSPSEQFIYFVNKRDLTLWSFDLSSS